MDNPFRSLGQVLIVAVTCVVIALAWIGSYAAIVAHQAASRARVEMAVRGKAALIAEQLRRELLVADQTLHILELEWEQNPAHFDFESWQRRVMALTDMSLQLFMTDAQGIVRASSRAEILGDNISARDYFRAEARPPSEFRAHVHRLAYSRTRNWAMATQSGQTAGSSRRNVWWCDRSVLRRGRIRPAGGEG